MRGLVKTLLIFCVVAAGLHSQRVAAQDPLYILRANHPSTYVGGFRLASITVAFPGFPDAAGESLAGWSWGVCHNPGIIELVEVLQGTEVFLLNDGDGPDFYSLEILPGMGWTVQAVVSSSGDDILTPSFGRSMNYALYEALAPGSSALEFCTIGIPPVPIQLELESSATVDNPTIDNGCFTVSADDPDFTFTVNSVSGPYSAVSGSAPPLTTTIEIADATGGDNGTEGFTLSLRIDGPASATQVEPAGPVLLVNDGDGPDFFGVLLEPVHGPGIAVSCIYGLDLPTIHFSAAGDPVATLTFEPDAAALAGNDSGATVDLTFSPTVSMPPVPNDVLIFLDSIPVLLEHGMIILSPEPFFARGDVNADGSLGIIDPILAFQFLFEGGATPVCQDTVDFNDDGVMGIDDIIEFLNYLFLGGTPSAPPGPGTCGADATEDTLPECQYPEALCGSRS